MEGSGFRYFSLCSLFLTLVCLYVPANGQVIASCTNSMVTSFTPCLSYITSGNGTSPTADCCTSLKSLTNASTDCACNILTGNVPFQIPINRTLAVSLPRACNSSAIPLQCKAGVSPVSPVPAPGLAPSAISPSATPTPTATASPAPEAVTPASDTPSTLTPTSTPSGTGTTSPDIRPTLAPNSDATASTVSLQALLISAIGILVLGYY